MTDNAFEQELMDAIRRLSESQRQDVLSYAQQLGDQKPIGIPGPVLLERIKALEWPKEDIEEMKKAIEDCERIDWDEWE
jgi:hypothetical protein